MKAKFLLLFYMVSFLAFSQKQPEHTITLDSKITDINLHRLTGIPVVTTQGAVYGIDGQTGQKIWEFNESGLLANLNSLGQGNESSFSEIPFSPFGKFNQTIFNIKNGQKIIDDKTNSYTSIIDNKLIPNKKSILFFAKTANNKAKLFLTSLENNSILWESEITSNKKLEGFMGFGGLTDFIQNNEKIAFVAGKTIFLVNKLDGNIILSKKYDAGKLFFTEDGKSLIAVENKSSSLIGGAIKAGFTMGLSLIGKKVIGKELLAFDTNSGEEVWKRPIKLEEGFVDYQFIDGKLFVIHKDGAMLYDYHNGEEVWKKEFKKNKVKSVEKTDEGYLVYYKNKKHLVDNTGKKIWKKPEKVIKNVDFEVDDDEDFTVFTYKEGNLFLTPTRIEYFKNDQEKRAYKISIDEKEDKMAYDEINNSLILLKGKKLYILNPDKGLGDDQMKKIDFNDHKKINSIEIRENKYFINSNWEYIITDLSGNLIKQEYFETPGEGFRKLKNFGSAALAMASAKVYTSTDSKGNTVVNVSSSANIVNDQNAKDAAYISKNGETYEEISNFLYTPERFSAFKATKNSAFFYTKKDGKKILLQINKDTGDLIESFEFGVNEPKYEIDKPSKKIFFRKENQLMIFSYN
ncbi:PQQ-binding-like beta-propeller repeat protein [Tenacibaculum sp. TC6]|uniref:outer membrane protein assembly factor BamB family protein n=1 Tax=Tenacibaculum sp. TC6 TaxID=3423223 RepID=UPI003D36DCB6